MNEVMELYRGVFRTRNEATLLIDGTSRAGIEAALVSLVEPGQKVLVPVFGRFGYLLKEIALRVGAEVAVREKEWGQVFTAEEIEQAIVEERPALLALVQGDTSTTMNQPLEASARSAPSTACCSTPTPPPPWAATSSWPMSGGSTPPPPACRNAWAAPPAPAPSR